MRIEEPRHSPFLERLEDFEWLREREREFNNERSTSHFIAVALTIRELVVTKTTDLDGLDR